MTPGWKVSRYVCDVVLFSFVEQARKQQEWTRGWTSGGMTDGLTDGPTDQRDGWTKGWTDGRDQRD